MFVRHEPGKVAPRWGYLNVQGDYLVGGADPIFDEKLFKAAVIAEDKKGLADDNPAKKASDASTGWWIVRMNWVFNRSS